MKIQRNAIVVGLAIVLSTAVARTAPDQIELLSSGPVESINEAASTVSVLGRQIALRDVSTISQGQRINVFGQIAMNGNAHPVFVQRTSSFAASGDLVQLSGKVTAVNVATGRLLVEGATVDYTGLLSGPQFVLPAVGDIVRVAGTQPAGHGLVLARELGRISSVIGSTDKQSVIGSTDKQSVIGSTVAQSVIGSTISTH